MYRIFYFPWPGLFISRKCYVLYQLVTSVTFFILLTKLFFPSFRCELKSAILLFSHWRYLFFCQTGIGFAIRKLKLGDRYCSDEFELEFSGSSRAELGHFNFRAETELTILTICMSKNSKFLTYFPILLLYHDSNQFHDHLFEFM